MKKTSLVPTRRYFAVVTTLAVFFWGMVILSRAIQPESSSSEAGTADIPTAEVEAAQKQYHEAYGDLLAARARATTAKQEFEDFVSQHFEAQRGALQELKTAAKSSAPVEAQQMVANPRHQELAARLHDLELRKSDLLRRLTPLHPEVQDLDAEIAQVDRSLETTPEFLPPEDGAEAGPSLAQEQVRDEQIEREREVIAGYERTHARFVQAEQTLQQATARERRMAELQAAAVAQSPTHKISINRRDAATHWPVLALVASLALVAGAAVALVGRKKATTFVSVEDVEATLRIPVVGVISGAGRPKSVRGAPGLLRGFVLLAELTVAIFVFSVLALSVDNVKFLPALLADPVAGFARGVELLTTMNVR